MSTGEGEAPIQEQVVSQTYEAGAGTQVMKTSDLASAIAKEANDRVKAGSQELNAMLTKYNLVLIPVVNIIGNQLTASVTLRARPIQTEDQVQ